MHGLELAPNPGDVLEELQRLGHRHVQHLCDALALEQDLQRLAVVPVAPADLAGYGNVGQELHLDDDVAVAGAGLASAALDVEGEPPRLVAPDAGLGDGGEELPDGREHSDVGSRVASGGAADGGLVDVDNLVDVVDTLDAVAIARPVPRPVECLRQLLVEDLVDQRALARARDSGDTDQRAQRDANVDVLEVVGPRPLDRDEAAVAGSAGVRRRDLTDAAKVLTGYGVLGRDYVVDRAGGDHVAPVLAGAGSQVHDVVRGPHYSLVVLHDDDGVAQVAQPLEGFDEPVVVGRVQPDRRLVADVQDAHQARADLSGQPNPLGLAAAERGGAARQRQVVEAYV